MAHIGVLRTFFASCGVAQYHEHYLLLPLVRRVEDSLCFSLLLTSSPFHFLLCTTLQSRRTKFAG